MTLSEEAMSYLEEHIPELANVAFKQAYWVALASGSSVLISENGDLVEVFPGQSGGTSPEHKQKGTKV
jgi:hypothetical protein